VLDHFKRWPQRSLGVVAFSLPQSDAIDAAVEILRKNDPAFDEWCGRDDLEPFFVKNLENVQGDERDVMFFSVGYGPDERGQVSMNFGPLNQEGGHRRLNVAITRARENVKVVTCLDPAQIDLSKTAAQGVQLFKHYLEFAKNGTSALGSAADNGRDESGSQFEDEVFEALGKRGLVLRKQVGVSGYRIDIAVIDPRLPGRYALGIECDGATYHSFKTARDRDRLRQQVLEGLGWRIARIWSRDWVENREREIQRILSCVKASMNP